MSMNDRNSNGSMLMNNHLDKLNISKNNYKKVGPVLTKVLSNLIHK